MKTAIRWLCLTAALLYANGATAQEPIPTPSPLGPPYGILDSCTMGYTSAWFQRAQPVCRCQSPLGTSVNAALAAQVDNGIGAYLTLYRYDFQSGEAAERLSPHGLARLHRFAHISLQTGLPIVLEATLDNPTLNTARRRFVVKELVSIDPNFVDEMVAIRRTTAPGLRTEDFDLIYQTQLQNTKNRGPSLGNSIGD